MKALRSDDVAFSLGDCSAYGICCVKFGMLSDPVDLADLVKVVAEKGKEIENSPQVGIFTFIIVHSTYAFEISSKSNACDI